MNIFLIHHRSKHHAENSGYGRLLDFVNATVVYGKTSFPYRLAKSIAALHTQRKGNYNVGSVLKSIELYSCLKKHKKEHNVVHFLNGERDIRHLKFFKRKFPNTKFYATFHKPPEILKKTISNTAALQQLDGAIAVGMNQVAFLKNWLQLDNVAYIPHGVDTSFFKPDASLKKKNQLLFVGQHLRDFDTLNATVPQLAHSIPDLHINVVLHPAYASKVTPHNGVAISTNINDTHLRTLYQESTLLYLPMLNSTACNSLLEAMACGLPIITSAVGGNEGYLESTATVLIAKGKEAEFITATEALLKNKPLLHTMGELVREKAISFDWQKVAALVTGFYANKN